MAMTTAQKTDMYRFFSIAFNAAPGVTYMGQLETALAANMTTKQVVNVFTTKPDFLATYPTYLDDAMFAVKLIENVVGTSATQVNKDAAAADVKAALASGMTRGDVVYQIFTNLAAKVSTDAAWGATATMMNNKVAVAAYYTETLVADSTNLTTLRAVLANVTATTDVTATGLANSSIATATATATGLAFTLTTSADIFNGNGGNDTIYGSGEADTAVAAKQSLNASDVIDGGAGKDTLNLVFTAVAGDVTNAAVIKNVEVINVRETGAFTATLDADKVTGLTNLNLSTSIGALTVTNLAAGAAVGIIGNSLTTEGVLTFDYKVPASAVTINLDGGVKQAAAVASITTTAGVATTATINSTSAANTTGGIKLSSGTTVTALTINADANLKATDAATTAEITGFKAAVTNNTITVKGLATTVDIGTVDATVGILDASGMSTGGLTATSANADLVVKGGAGKDTITLTTGATLSTKASFTLGAGDDKLITSTAATTLGAQVADGGDGADTIAAVLINVASASNVKNFESLDLAAYASSLDATLLTASTITKAALTAAAGTGATLINLPGTTSFDITGFADQAAYSTATLGTVALKQAGAATSTTDSMAVNFNAAAVLDQIAGGNFSTLNVLNLTGTETVSISSTGSAKVDGNAIVTLNDTLNQMSKIVVTGDKAFELDAANTNTAATTATADVASSLTLIDGSAATGKLTISAGTSVIITGAFSTTYTGLTIKGGTAADVITTAAKNGVVDAGAGNDKIIVSDIALVKSNVVTVTGGIGADSLESKLTYKAIATASSSATDGDFVLFADAATGDVISFATLTFANATGAFGAKTVIGTAATFDQAVLAAESATVSSVTWFQYNGNTYIENNGPLAGTADNVVIKLTGLVDLSAAALNTTTDLITLA